MKTLVVMIFLGILFSFTSAVAEDCSGRVYMYGGEGEATCWPSDKKVPAGYEVLVMGGSILVIKEGRLLMVWERECKGGSLEDELNTMPFPSE